MLNIIEGSNFVGKTTTLEILKKKSKSFIYVYHPRFNDSENYLFNYTKKYTILKSEPTKSVQIHIPRDVVYQISHVVCLKYLESFKDKNVLLDRIFLSEMVYNDLYDKQMYKEFIRILKENFDYKIYLLECARDEELKNRIRARLENDKTKGGFGVRIGTCIDPETIEEKFTIQRLLHARYEDFIKTFDLNHIKIDTSDISQKEVAKIILEDIKSNRK